MQSRWLEDLVIDKVTSKGAGTWRLFRLLFGDQDQVDALLAIIGLILIAAEDTGASGSILLHQTLHVGHFQPK